MTTPLTTRLARRTPAGALLAHLHLADLCRRREVLRREADAAAALRVAA